MTNMTRIAALAAFAATAGHEYVVTAAPDQAPQPEVVRASKSEHEPIIVHQRGAVRTAAFSPDGTRFVTAGEDKAASIWNAVTGEPVLTLYHGAPVLVAAYSPDGTRVATASADGKARLWDAVTGRWLIELELIHEPGKDWLQVAAPRAPAFNAEFSADGTRILMVLGERLWVWEAATGQKMLSTDQGVTEAAFGPDSARFVAVFGGAAAGSVMVLTLGVRGSSLERGTLPPGVLTARFSRDGKRLVTGSRDGTARVWDAATGRPLGPPIAHEDPVVSVMFGPDRRRLLTAAGAQARVWDADTGKPASPAMPHAAAVRSATFSPDGRRILTVSNDGIARVWRDGVAISPPLQHDGTIWAASFRSDGERVLTAGSDGTARVWHATAPTAPAPRR